MSKAHQEIEVDQSVVNIVVERITTGRQRFKDIYKEGHAALFAYRDHEEVWCDFLARVWRGVKKG